MNKTSPIKNEELKLENETQKRELQYILTTELPQQWENIIDELKVIISSSI